MDWDLAIKRNSKALKGIIEVLFALLGLDGTDAASRIPRSLHSAVLGVLRPAESAVRRLIVIAARNIVVKLAPSRPMPEGRKIGKGGGSSRSLLPALRSAETFEARAGHEIHAGLTRASVSSTTIPGFVPCFQRPGLWLNPRRRPMAWSVRRASTAGSRPSSSPSRICRARPSASCACRRGGRPRHGRSPHRRSGRAIRRATAGKPIHEVDEVLIECDWLAWEAMKPDTS